LTPYEIYKRNQKVSQGLLNNLKNALSKSQKDSPERSQQEMIEQAQSLPKKNSIYFFTQNSEAFILSSVGSSVLEVKFDVGFRKRKLFQTDA